MSLNTFLKIIKYEFFFLQFAAYSSSSRFFQNQIKTLRIQRHLCRIDKNVSDKTCIHFYTEAVSAIENRKFRLNHICVVHYCGNKFKHKWFTYLYFAYR